MNIVVSFVVVVPVIHLLSGCSWDTRSA